MNLGFLQKMLIPLLALGGAIQVNAQCVSISCPANVVVNNSTGSCGTVVNYTAPVGTTTCTSNITFSYTGSIVNWTVPAGVTSITIQAVGAQGGYSTSSGTTSGLGASMTGTFTVTPGQQLKILVGQQAPNSTNGGGGGTFVTDISNNPLIVAGGGGGSAATTDSPDKHGQTTTTGGAGASGGGAGGTGGNGGSAGTSSFNSGAGGGLLTDGANGSALGGAAFVNGGAGGNIYAIGGFGGGGAGSGYVVGGGGGGYSGGGGGGNNASGVGGGGGSFNGGTSQTNVGGTNTGNGFVIITVPSALTTTQTAGLASGATFPVGVTTNTYSVTDGTNTTTCSFTVTVVDNEPPVLNCPSNVIVNNTPNSCGAIVNYTAPVGTDNCAGTVTTQTAGLPSGATFPVGVTTNTYSATDNVGLTTTCSFTVTVIDNEPPALNCPANILVNNTPNVCGAVVNYTAPVGTDNCPGVITTQTAGLASGATFPVGVTTNTYSTTDNVGLTTTCSFTVTVVDNEQPVIVCPANINTSTDAGICGAVVTYTSPVGTDNCPGALTSYIGGGLSGAVYPTGVNTVTFQVVDNVGLTGTCSFDITVTDNEDPTILCPGNVSTCVSTVNNIAPGVSADNCGVTSVAFATTGATILSGANNASGQTFNTGTTNVVYTATDAEGNTGTCNFDVVIVAPTNILAGTSGSTESNVVNVNGTTDALYTDCDLITTVVPSGVDPLTGNVNFSVTIDPAVNNYNGQLYLQRHYDIEPAVNAATATANITLYALQSEFDAFNTASNVGDLLLPTGGVDNGNVRVTQYHGTGTAPGNYTGAALGITPAVSWDAVNNWWEITFPVTGFSGFYIHTGFANDPLAIHLINIAANNIGTGNRITWATATEAKNDKFGLEHSVDGISFKEIYKTAAKGSAAQYLYLHETPATGKNYYRLKLYDASDKFTYSDIVTATVKGADNFAIQTYPNPVQNTLTVKITGTIEKDSRVVLTDIAGKVIATQDVTNNTVVFDMTDHANGIYFIRYTDSSHSEVLKVNKQ
jgi:hypothetical protein